MFPMGKRSFKSEEEEEGEEVKEEEEKESEMEERVNGNGKKIVIRVVFGQRLRTPMVGGSSSLCCQADECGVDLRMAKKYHQRHKVCERHSKAAVVLVSGIRQRFCQQCSFMNFNSLMTPKEVVGKDWQVITNVEEKPTQSCTLGLNRCQSHLK